MAQLERPAALDLFAGAGGLSLGLHWAGWRTAVAIDHDPVTVETLQANFSHHGTVALLRDLGKLTPKKLEADLSHLNIEHKFDAIVGGPPCQGWSNVGRGKLRSLKTKSRRDIEGDPRNHLYENFLRTIDHFRPQVAVMENVPGMLSHNGRNVAELIAETMEAIDYKTTWAVLNAMDYGVPQVRNRLFFVGVRKDLGIEFRFPEAHTATGKRLYPLTTVRDAIADLPTLRNGGRKWILPYTEKTGISAFAKLMRKQADRKTVFDHVCRAQNDDDVEAFRLMKEGGLYRDLPARFKRYREDIFDDKYRKLYWDRQSWCVTAHLSKDCYTHIHPSQARTISVREAARLQSFPDNFYFGGNMGNKFQMIGNAVPPMLAQRIGTAILAQVFPNQLARFQSSVA
jgi:DNA (cytosine-5)-methyltransferase 1